MTRIYTLLAVAIGVLVAFPASSQGQIVTHRDNFDVFHDYHTGTVPAGGIWTGVHNPTAGDGIGGVPVAVFQANGVDAFGTPHPGTLFIEDLNGGPAGTGTGWNGAGGADNRNTAPMIYREVDPADDWEAKIKVDAQTAGQWSSAGIVARRAGPPVGVSPLDPTEQFVLAAVFRTNAGVAGDANMITKNIVNGANATDASIAFIPGTPTPTAPLPVYVRLLKEGGTITSQASFDGNTWVTRTVITNTAALVAPGQMLQIGPSFMMFNGGQGSADIDFFELNIGLPPITGSTWNIAGGGNWGTQQNWASIPRPGIPNSNQVEVTFGATATANATVFTDANVMARRLVFNNANKYAIAGTGTLTLEASGGGNAEIAVLAGSHEIQTATTLTTSNLAVSTVAGSRLDINNRLNLNGRTLTSSGGGVLSVNNNLITGTGGTLANSGSTLQGTGTVNGNLQNISSGTVAPGNSAGKLSVTGNYIQQAGSTLLMELGGTADGQYDELVVGGNLTANGNLTVQLINGFMPAGGNSFDVLDWGGTRSGTLTLNLPSLSPGLAWNTTSLTTTGVLSVTGTGDADFNNDSRVDGADFMIWQRGLGIGSGANNSQGDANGDGAVTGADLSIWKGTFGGAVVVSAGVPEPATFALASLAFAGMAARRRRR